MSGSSREPSAAQRISALASRATLRSIESLKGRVFEASPTSPLPKVLIVGAGMSGIALGMRLRAAGHTDFTILEKAATPGGTWRDNTYPGLTCDVPAHYYSYSTEHNAHWSSFFAPGNEIRAYLEHVLDKHGLEPHIRYNTEVRAGEFRDGAWRITTTTGEVLSSDVLVCATGTLHRPKYPDITGLESFGGKMFHSARWDHSTSLRGARVGIIGSGSTGAQITTALSTIASHVTLFQRTPQWVASIPNPGIPLPVRAALHAVPGLDGVIYAGLRATFNSLSRSTIEDGWQRWLFTTAARRSLAQVKDPELRAKLTPSDKPMCKRLVISGGFYDAVQRDTVHVEDTAIDHIDRRGVVTADGRLHELDVLVLATGFDAQAFVRPIELTGPTGVTLEQAWQAAPRAHNTTMVPGLPNLFLLMGPNSPIGNSSLVPIAEAQADYTMHWLHRMRARGIVEVEPTQNATDRFYESIAAAMPPTIWVSGCDSWYIGPDGVPMLWPWTLQEFKAMLAHPDHREFIERLSPTTAPVLQHSPSADEFTA